MTFLLTLAALAVAFLPTNPDHFRQQAAWYLIICSIGLGLWIGKKLSWTAGALFSWCMVEGVRFFAVPDEDQVENAPQGALL